MSLSKFIEQKNRTANLFGGTVFDVNNINQESANKLYYQLDSNMSPENLCCDGELSTKQVAQRSKLFTGAVADLDSLGFVRPDNLWCI